MECIEDSDGDGYPDSYLAGYEVTVNVTRACTDECRSPARMGDRWAVLACHVVPTITFGDAPTLSIEACYKWGHGAANPSCHQ